MNISKRIVSLVTSFAILAASVFSVYQRQAIFDWVKLRDYVPPPQIATLATSTTMNDKGKHLFYVYRPELDDKTTFNQNCSDSEQSIVLGCYVQNKGIYLYDVQDERLDGVEEVTAAHEMLHAAYDRLSSKDRRRIDALTQQVFESTTNARIKKTVEAYRAKDATVVPNELHSIIATEVRELPKELEEYYARYFDNRKTIVAMSEKYEHEFTGREAQADAYKLELDSLKIDIEASEKQLEKDTAALTAEYNAIEQDRSSADPTAFNARVRSYNAKVGAYNKSVKAVSTKIDTYNATLEKYKAVVLEENELIKAIDSRPNQIQSQ